MSKKVIEPVVIQQGNVLPIKVSQFDFNTIELNQPCMLNGKQFVLVNESNATTVAKAIDPEYQKVIDHYEFAKRNNVETGKFIRHLKDQNAKLVEALEEAKSLIHSVTFDDPDICNLAKEKINAFYNKVEALQNTKNIEG